VGSRRPVANGLPTRDTP